MGIQSLQDYVDSCGRHASQLSKVLETSKRKTSNLLLIHADSCFRQFYHENIDWVCGGQWSELFQCVEKFVRAFRQSDIELVVFFDGCLTEYTLYQWSMKHRFTREVVKETLSHIIHNQNIPFRTKTKNFVTPGSFKSALRLAFRACEVIVCCSIKDVYKESILYAKDQNCLGILGNDANYFFYNAPCYISLGSTRWMKKFLSACKVYSIESLLKELLLTKEDLPYFSALLGNFVISDSLLSSFYWSLIEDDNPIKKVKDNLSCDAVLPPSEVRLKCVAKFLHSISVDDRDVDNLAKLVFSESKNITINKGAEKLKKIIDFYKDNLDASLSSICNEKESDTNLSKAGFPLPVEVTAHSNVLNKYKKDWDYRDKIQQSSSQKLNKDNNEETVTKKLDDPEQILKQGTLEEAAQALEQLELKEAEEISQPKEESQCEEKPEVVAVDEEKPDTMAIINCEDSDENQVLSDYPREISVSLVNPDISEDVLNIAKRRHQTGQMCPEVLHLLTKGEIMLDLTIDDELATSRLPIPLIYRPMRQLVYGVLFGVKQNIDGHVEKAENVENEEKEKINENGEIKEETEEANVKGLVNGTNKPPTHVDTSSGSEFTVKEWCIYADQSLDKPDIVQAKGMNWGIPSLKKLWFGTDSEDNANRLKAFLSCMKSDTINMSNTAMVPQRLMLLCCVLRYLIQQDSGKAVLTKQDIDAFLAQALSTQLTTEYNTQNLANIKLNQVDARCVQLSAIFMSGIENAIIANDACGSPVPWEFCCPWNFFDGKLFHSKWLQSTMNFSTTDLCDGKPHIAEKLERLRWCITEGLEAKHTITGLQENKKFFNPFGNVPTMQSGPTYGVMRPAGSYLPINTRQRSRGPHSKRPVHGSGGTLHVAGVPVAHWGGNKAGLGYSKNAPSVLVGGPNSVDLPSSHRRNNRLGRGYGGRGLLETPYMSPWQQGYGYEEYMNATYQRYMKGVQKVCQVRSRVNKSNRHSGPSVYSSRTRHQDLSHGKHVANKKDNTWYGNGRGRVDNDAITSEKDDTKTQQPTYGRGIWLSASE
ncbi:constitutive coactivator of PPAR-gamma-like protein 1 [Hydractinia symbiolongicarpus]|uniref:constitutive coactivator of PPAR-gamma-like protein 1 n=1 Tax=Hydractinia symbiolongicarpus TaxID=13093 RepID=UPI00254E0EDA|nr:constitutive coactivator of PPAR-gamma-like protein 1 [Hydractinia symbiolongicarpus]